MADAAEGGSRAIVKKREKLKEKLDSLKNLKKVIRSTFGRITLVQF